MGPETADDRLRLIADTISEVVWIAAYDMSQIFYISPAYERVWGRSCQSLYRNPRSFLDAIHPDDLPRVLHDLEVEYAGRAFDHEYRIVLGDGSVKWIWDRGYPEHTPAGRVERYVGVAQDITARKVAQQERAAVAERLQLVSRATRDAVWDWDITTNATWWSDVHYEELGYSRDLPPTFEAWVERIHPDDRARVLESVKRAMEDGSVTWAVEYRFNVPGSPPREMLDRAYVLHDSAGKPVRMVGAMMDVTEQRRLERQLRQAQKVEAVGQLAGGIAHDFNNILSLIIGQADLLLGEFKSGDRGREGIEEIRTAAARASDLTRQLLMFSRHQIIQPRETNVSSVLEATAKMLRRLVGEDIELSIDRASQVAKVLIDPGQMTQVILNLVANARDAMPRGGRLKIETRDVVVDDDSLAKAGVAPGAYVLLEVSDNGAGMDATTRAQIFERFFTTKEPGRGTGLGLATVSGIVDEWGGTIVTTSEPGQGTTFRIYIPQVTTTEPQDEQPKILEGQQIPMAFGRQTVLLVEDDDALRSLLRTVLQRHGYEVLEAANGHEALLLCESEGKPIDLLLTDVVMPFMSGRELAERLLRSMQGVKVLYMSGYTDGILDNHGVLDEGIELVSKPLAPNVLVSKVRELLGE
jgi:PAS domain S-box-containing protein